ncbi:helix-turn-helix domain-containing protein, partial [Sphingobium amiense]
MPDSFGLSEKQRDCLHLVGQGLTSKEIARRLNTSAGVIDNYILAAVRIMGVSTRREAAQMLRQRESEAMQQLHVQPANLASRVNPGELIVSNADRDETSSTSASMPREEPGSGRLVRALAHLGAATIDHVGGEPHNLKRWEVPLAILFTSLLTTAILAAIIAIYYWT